MRHDPISPNDSGEPLVSIVMFVRNGGALAERAAKSVLQQTWQNIELVVQDACSTDGTAARLAALDSRVRVESEPDSGPSEGLWRSLCRCRGEIVGTCLTDETLEPDAVEVAVRHFQNQPESGALIGNALACEIDLKPIKTIESSCFDLVEFMAGRYMPYFNATFFNAKALRSIGVGDDGWHIDCLEFELWFRLAIDWDIDICSHVMARYAWHDAQLSNSATHVLTNIRARLNFIEHVFSSDGFFGENPSFRDFCLYSHAEVFRDHLLAQHHQAAALELSQRLDEIIARAGGDPRSARSQADKINLQWSRLAYATPGWLRELLGPQSRAAGRKIFQMLMRTAIPIRSIKNAPFSLAAFYRDVALLFENRGQLSGALKYYLRAFNAGDDDAGSLACQAMLKMPGATELDQKDIQVEWVERCCMPEAPNAPKSPILRGGRITVGYIGSAWLSPYMRYQVMNFASRHDRERFRVIAYSGLRDRPAGAEAFDEFRWTGNMSDEAFAAQVRADEVDILVELNGFSPGHRFAALASRLAPVQVSYINHDATSGTPNVDWLLADDIAAPAGIDADFTEGIWRLPQCFVCFDYSQSNSPDPLPAPVHKEEHITFGFFGSAAKINATMVELWARLLHRVPGSRLFIRNAGMSALANREFLLRRFARHDINPTRLIFLPGAAREQILVDHGQVDISLDTSPYCGGNTIAESLWQGVPVVTLRGQRFASAYGASILTATGCSELVAETPDEYVELAANLAEDIPQLDHYRQNLRQMMLRASGFSDSAAFVARLEDAYAAMIKKKC